MDWTNILVAVITAAGALLGTYFANRKSASLVEYRLEELEKKVDRHNNLIERTYKLEEQVAVHDEKIKVANNRIKNLEDDQR